MINFEACQDYLSTLSFYELGRQIVLIHLLLVPLLLILFVIRVPKS